MNNFKKKIALYFEVILLITATSFYFGHYWTIAHIASLRHIDYAPYLMTSIDKGIPYVDWFLPFYLIGFIFPATIVFLFIYLSDFKFDISVVRRMACGAISLISVSYLSFLAFPTSMGPLINSVNLDADKYFLFNGFFSVYNKVSMPFFNAFPSLHISVPWFMLLTLFHFIKMDKIKEKVVGSLLIFVFICIFMATLTLKYHYLLDVLCGLVMGSFTFAVVLKTDFFRTKAWDAFFGSRNLLFMEVTLTVISILSFLIAYPTYMQLGH
jgi:membrane-associated phospholipid phosphatase